MRTNNRNPSPRIKNIGTRTKFASVDNFNRKVNSKGYLIDDKGNIINNDDEVIFKAHELMFGEPPKIFCFTEFSLNWIMGHLGRDVTQNPRHDD